MCVVSDELCNVGTPNSPALENVVMLGAWVKLAGAVHFRFSDFRAVRMVEPLYLRTVATATS